MDVTNKSARPTRQQAIARGLKRYFGKVCPKHPELKGERRFPGHCVACFREQLKIKRRAKFQTPEYRAKHREKERKRRQQQPPGTLRFSESGDAIAIKLKRYCRAADASLDLAKLQNVGELNGVWDERWSTLNPGMQRLNVGNRLRALAKNQRLQWPK